MFAHQAGSCEYLAFGNKQRSVVTGGMISSIIAVVVTLAGLIADGITSAVVHAFHASFQPSSGRVFGNTDYTSLLQDCLGSSSFESTTCYCINSDDTCFKYNMANNDFTCNAFLTVIPSRLSASVALCSACFVISLTFSIVTCISNCHAPKW